MLGSYSTQYKESIFRAGYRFQSITQERLDLPGIQSSGFAGYLTIVRAEQSVGPVRAVTLRGYGPRGRSIWRRSQDAACSDDTAGKLMRLVFQKQ
jgi:hypothetical protein